MRPTGITSCWPTPTLRGGRSHEPSLRERNARTRTLDVFLQDTRREGESGSPPELNTAEGQWGSSNLLNPKDRRSAACWGGRGAFHPRGQILWAAGGATLGEGPKVRWDREDSLLSWDGHIDPPPHPPPARFLHRQHCFCLVLSRRQPSTPSLRSGRL